MPLMSSAVSVSNPGDRADCVGRKQGAGVPTGWWPSSRRTLGAVAALALLGSGCTTMQTYIGRNAAHKPPAASTVQPVTPAGSAALKLWAGDANFQLPEGDFKASLELPKVLQTIKKSGLDFVFFAPSQKSKFYEDQNTLDSAVQRWREIRQFLETVPEPKPLFLPGLQIVDRAHGNVSLLFLDFAAMTVDLKAKNFRQSPQLFYYSAKAFGGLLFIDTPFATPVKMPVDAPDRFTSIDRSWRPITDAGRDIKSFPPEIQAADELAFGLEAYSIPVSVWRDQYGLDNPLHSLVASMQRMDEEILRRKRRMVPIAGSDSRQGKHLHPTMYIAAPTRTPQALREGMLRGRVCIRSPEPCAVRVYADDDGLPQGVGASVKAKQRVELRWQGEGEVFRNGVSYGAFDSRATVPADSQCSVLRLVVDGGYSAPIYVNCPFADIDVLP